jgi:hypothetical protein
VSKVSGGGEEERHKGLLTPPPKKNRNRNNTGFWNRKNDCAGLSKGKKEKRRSQSFAKTCHFHAGIISRRGEKIRKL